MAETEKAPTPAEQRKRQQAVDFARASLRLEGFTPSAEAESWAAHLVTYGYAESVLRNHPSKTISAYRNVLLPGEDR